MDLHARGSRVAVFVDKYPCLSESFVRRELASLEFCGFSLAILACSRASRCDTWLPFDLCSPIFHVDDLSSHGPCLRRTRRWTAAAHELHHACSIFPSGPRGIAAAARAAWTASAFRRLLGEWKPDWIHAHFLGMPAATGCLLAESLSLPFSISAHARDIFVPTVRFGVLCERAQFVAVCSENAQASLQKQLPEHLRMRVEYLPHFVSRGILKSNRDERDHVPLRLLSVCRLVPKKGIDVVLLALAALSKNLHFTYRVAGDGPELPRLRELARKLGLRGVQFLGPLPPDAVAAEFSWADIFVLGTRTASDGDRDGIPNALLEAMAAGVPVVASDGGSVSEIVQHRRTGWLPAANSPERMADSLREAALDRMLRQEIAEHAYAEVMLRFSGDRNQELLAARLAAEILASRESGSAFRAIRSAV